jgi:hypothetical protein
MAETREQAHARYLRNREKVAAQSREYYVRNREKVIEQQQLRRKQNPEVYRERDRERGRTPQRKASKSAWWREYYAANRDAYSAKDRERRRRDHHGMQPEDWTRMWAAQGGRCYLCGEELALEQAHVDHDHGCCPKGWSCQICRRGLACLHCNTAIGSARDDPARLRRMADALEAAQAVVNERKLAGPPTYSQLDVPNR